MTAMHAHLNPSSESFPAELASALRELSALPYENISKIVAYSQGGNRENTLGLSVDWLARTRDTGAGGTCFSLTWWLAQRLKAAGLVCAFLMGDKGHSANIHCGLRFDWQGLAYLLDPGYLIFEPLLLPGAGLATEAWLSPNRILVEDVPGASVWRLWTGQRAAEMGVASGKDSGLKLRFDFRKQAVTEAEFLSHWGDSYEWPMMHYPVLNRVVDGVQYYLQKRSLLVRTAEGGSMRKLSQPEMLRTLQVTFALPEDLARAGLDVVLCRQPDFFQR